MTLTPETPTALVLEAALFAADRHRYQKRKDEEASPYINHPLSVARILAVEAEVANEQILAAALLHDTVEDTETTPEELGVCFGESIRVLVAEVTDDKQLEKQERKDLQVEHAPHLSPAAKQLKIADKIANLRDIMERPPVGWDAKRKMKYVDWAKNVVAGCRGVNATLDAVFDTVATEAARTLARG